MEDAVRAHLRSLAQRDLRIDVRARAHNAVFADEHLRLDDGAVADDGILLDDRVRAHVDVRAELHGRIDDRRRMNARRANGHGRREQLGRRHAGVVRIRHADDGAGRAVRPVRRQQDGGSLRGLHELDVLHVLAERKVALASLLEAAAREQFDVIPFQRTAEPSRQLTCLHSSAPSPYP